MRGRSLGETQRLFSGRKRRKSIMPISGGNSVTDSEETNRVPPQRFITRDLSLLRLPARPGPCPLVGEIGLPVPPVPLKKKRWAARSGMGRLTRFRSALAAPWPRSPTNRPPSSWQHPRIWAWVCIRFTLWRPTPWAINTARRLFGFALSQLLRSALRARRWFFPGHQFLARGTTSSPRRISPPRFNRWPRSSRQTPSPSGPFPHRSIRLPFTACS